MSVGFNYYIYYKVRADAATRHAETCERLQLALQKGIGIRGRLLQSSEDPLSRMEVYEHIVDPLHFESLLATEVARLGMGEFLADGSRRHVERFTPCV